MTIGNNENVLIIILFSYFQGVTPVQDDTVQQYNHVFRPNLSFGMPRGSR